MKPAAKRIAAVILILMALFAAIRIGTAAYENAVRASGQIPYQTP